MNEHIIDAVVDKVEQDGLSAIELGLAAVGVVATGYAIVNVFKNARTRVKNFRNFGDDLMSSLEDLEQDPKFKKVKDMFAKRAAKKQTASEEEKGAC